MAKGLLAEQGSPWVAWLIGYGGMADIVALWEAPEPKSGTRQAGPHHRRGRARSTAVAGADPNRLLSVSDFTYVAIWTGDGVERSRGRLKPICCAPSSRLNSGSVLRWPFWSGSENKPTAQGLSLSHPG